MLSIALNAVEHWICVQSMFYVIGNDAIFQLDWQVSTSATLNHRKSGKLLTETNANPRCQSTTTRLTRFLRTKSIFQAPLSKLHSTTIDIPNEYRLPTTNVSSRIFASGTATQQTRKKNEAITRFKCPLKLGLNFKIMLNIKNSN